MSQTGNGLTQELSQAENQESRQHPKDFFALSAESLTKAVLELTWATPYPDSLMAKQILLLPNLRSRLEAAMQHVRTERKLVERVHTYCFFSSPKTSTVLIQDAIDLLSEAIELNVVFDSVAQSSQFTKAEIDIASAHRKQAAENLLPLANSV